LSLTKSINSPPFAEPEGSLPCSQEPTTAPHIQLFESSPHLISKLSD